MTARGKQTKELRLYLPGDVYARLEQRGEANERDPIQEARYILKQALDADSIGAMAALVLGTPELRVLAKRQLGELLALIEKYDRAEQGVE